MDAKTNEKTMRVVNKSIFLGRGSVTKISTRLKIRLRNLRQVKRDRADVTIKTAAVMIINILGCFFLIKIIPSLNVDALVSIMLAFRKVNRAC